MMDDFKRYLDKQLNDPAFREEWEALQPEMAIAQAVIDSRVKAGMTQKQLAKATGIAQGDISKLERGSGNPSIRTLRRLASGMGKRLKIEFVSPGG